MKKYKSTRRRFIKNTLMAGGAGIIGTELLNAGTSGTVYHS